MHDEFSPDLKTQSNPETFDQEPRVEKKIRK